MAAFHWVCMFYVLTAMILSLVAFWLVTSLMMDHCRGCGSPRLVYCRRSRRTICDDCGSDQACPGEKE